MRELNRQSNIGVENKLEEISARAHNNLAEMRSKLELETAKNIELETKLRNEQDSNHCQQSRLNLALELSQNELKDCQEQLRSLKATIPARDAEIETLKNQLHEKAKKLEAAHSAEQLVVALQEQVDRLKMENDQLRQQLEVLLFIFKIKNYNTSSYPSLKTNFHFDYIFHSFKFFFFILQSTKSDLNETIMNLEVKESIAANLEKAAKDKFTLEKKLKDSQKKEGL